jgi:prolyl-tRNA synthetase
VAKIGSLLTDIQSSLFSRARAFRDAHTQIKDDRASFDAFFTPKSADKPEIHGGFALSHWCGSSTCEQTIKEALKVTIRCIPDGGFEGSPWAAALVGEGKCVVCQGGSGRRVVFAKAY